MEYDISAVNTLPNPIISTPILLDTEKSNDICIA